jgi:hypothetical protein
MAHTMADQEWFWCLDHNVAVTAEDPCPPKRRLGPYPTRDAAESWQETVAARNAKWDAEDREWSGEEA